MSKRKMGVLALCFALTMTMGLSGCGKEEAAAPAATDAAATTTTADAADTTLKWALSSDIVSLDPIYAYDTATNQVVAQIVDYLLNISPTDGSLQPMLATSWQATDDVTYVYEIRDDVKFSDGTPMTVDDVIYSLERNMGDSDSYLGWMFDSVDSIEQTGDWEVTVHLKNPDAFWQYVPATTAGAVVNKAYAEEHAADFGTSTGGILGTGAYTVDHWTNGSEILLKANENYWDTEAPRDFTEIYYTIIPEDTTRVAALQTGQVDVSLNCSVDMIDQLEGAENLAVNSVHGYRIDHLAFNTEKAPFNDKYVRQAIAYAIDGKSLVDGIYHGYGVANDGLLFGDALYTIGTAEDWENFAKEKLNAYDYDIEKAKEALAKSAYPDGFDCTLAVSNISYYQSMGVYIQAALAEIGINVNVEQHTYDEMVTMQFGNTLDENGLKAFDMGIFDWQADFPDPAGNIRPILSSSNAGAGGSNTSSYSNPDVDKLFVAENASIDTNERIDLIKQYSQIINEDLPIYVLCYSNQNFAVNNRVKSEIGPLYFWDLAAKNFTMANK